MPCPQSVKAAPLRAEPTAAQLPRLLDRSWRPFGLRSYFHFVDPLEDTLLKIVRHGRVLEIFGHLLAVFGGPFQKFNELLSFGCVLLLLVNEQPSRACNRISIRSRRVRDGKAKIVRDIGCGQCRRDRLDRWLYKIAP